MFIIFSFQKSVYAFISSSKVNISNRIYHIYGNFTRIVVKENFIFLLLKIQKKSTVY